MGSLTKCRLPLNANSAMVIAAVVAFAFGVVLLTSVSGQHPHNPPAAATATSSGSKAGTPQSDPAVELSSSQLSAIKIEQVGTYLFPLEKETVGNIDFDGDLSVQVFPDYQGTIIRMLVELGAKVRKDQPLYTIRSPDLIQAESTLIAAAAAFELTNKELARAKDLNGTNGVSERELEQATSDQQTADGALKAARDAVRVFGKTEAEIDQMIATRKIDPALVVRSPISGTITSKNAQPGFLVQPGNAPAPYSVADISLKWMLADVPESDISLFRLGQPVQVKLMAYPNRVFQGKVSKIYATVDRNTHRSTIRSEISDPKDELRPGMLANFVIRVQNPVKSTAVPANGVVREPDGTTTAWVTTDRRHFSQRVIKTGLRVDGQVQILGGVHPGELVVSDGAIFLSNMLEAPLSD
jgi:membrane fusion protein, heavy metal efflux system